MFLWLASSRLDFLQMRWFMGTSKNSAQNYPRHWWLSESVQNRITKKWSLEKLRQKLPSLKWQSQRTQDKSKSLSYSLGSSSETRSWSHPLVLMSIPRLRHSSNLKNRCLEKKNHFIHYANWTNLIFKLVRNFWTTKQILISK